MENFGQVLEGLAAAGMVLARLIDDPGLDRTEIAAQLRDAADILSEDDLGDSGAAVLNLLADAAERRAEGGRAERVVSLALDC